MNGLPAREAFQPPRSEGNSRSGPSHPDEAENPPKTAAEAARWASWATWAVAVGAIDRDTAREICHGVKTFLAALEKSEMERKLEELRGQVKELKRLRAT